MRRILVSSTVATVLLAGLGVPAPAATAPPPGLRQPGAGPPLLIDPVLERVRALDLAAPDPAALAAANTLEAAVRAALPDAPPTPPLPSAAGLDPAIPAPLRGPVARLLVGLDAADALRASALPGDPGFIRDAAEAARYDTDLSLYADRIDHDALLRAALLLAATIDRALGEIHPAPDASCDGPLQPPAIEVEDQIAIDPHGTRTRYTKPYAVVIDLGGCDEYLAAIGGANGLGGDPASVLLDLGDDADFYANPPGTFGFGGALRGTAASVDGGGDDVYRTTGLGALGAGIVGGVGLHADLGGHDDYEFAGTGGGYGAQGHGGLGVGVMLDLGDGDDRYDFDFFSPAQSLTRLLSAQGVGIGGVGVLADAGGDDTYETGLSGNALVVEAQGVGLGEPVRGVLLDAGGDDSYLATVEGDAGPGVGGFGAVEAQGVGGHGYLVDGGGNDRYTMVADVTGGPGASAGVAGQGRGVGSFTRPAVGLLADLDGDDRYEATARSGADDPETTEATVRAQGEAFFFQGVGLLLDADGDDTYRLRAEAAQVNELGQGAATSAGTGVLLDADGNDTYVAGPRSQGYAETETFPGIGEVRGAIGALIDGGGRNTFTGPGSEDYLWVRGDTSIGVGIDGGEAHSVTLQLLDALLPVGRPQPVPTVAITSPQDGFVLHGAARVTGTSDGGGLDLDRVEHRVGDGRWALAERDGEGWETWVATLSAETLLDGDHMLRARAWASRLDSAVDTLVFEVERWTPVWLEPVRDGDEVLVAFDLITRAGEPVEAPGVALRIDGAEVPLESAGGRYTARVTIEEGDHDAVATIPGQVLGSTTFTI